MKIVFFGTPDFAVPILDKLNSSKHDVVAVVTAPDKQRGRGRKVTFTPVKEYAVENNIPILQPETMKNDDFIADLKALDADLFVIVAFRILPEEVYTIPVNGSFNLHGSLLPKYRGAAPIQWTLINGDEKTGLTTFFLERRVDTGNILLQKEITIDPSDNFETLHDKMSLEGAKLVWETVEKIDSGEFSLFPQDDSLASPAPKITKETCNIDWNKSSSEIHNLIRGLSPYPGAFFIHNEKQYKVYKSESIDENDLSVGEFEQTKKEIICGCGKGKLKILEIQPEGRKRMTSEEFLRGYKL